ncbi:hypothetical protein Patl1_20776 [Pistacia atlantica]|uniref:Uncharacterized protein n=1 Tax=Pistacia atlantica TaxID=434234 RepID=A0ACC1BN58_9ROSI|nr:hypothetical protein Patl1_20776 [Pistacia atlantica]
MLGEYGLPDDHTFPSATKSCAILGRLDVGESVHCLVVKTGYDFDVFVCSSLLDKYAKCGDIKTARKVFDEMPERTVVSWTGMIYGYAQLGLNEEALKLFKQALYDDLELGKQIHGFCVKTSFESSNYVGSSLVSLYSKCGVIDEAYLVFAEVPVRIIGMWNAMLIVCAQHSHTNKAFDLFKEMEVRGIKPNSITFLCVLCACSLAGLVEKGQYYFELMKEYGIEPRARHYASLVDLLGHAGKLLEAVSVISKMPIAPTESVWGALLTGCLFMGTLNWLPMLRIGFLSWVM